MAHAPEEVEEMTSLAGALVLNIGTLERDWVKAMIMAGGKANEIGIPVILDPVGAGATRYRTETALEILREVEVSVVRGNASEIMALEGVGGARGVDSAHGVEESRQVAVRLAARLGAVLAVTGPVDFVTDGEREMEVANGHPLMGRVTGTGCVSTAMAAAFAAGEKDLAEPVASALACFGLAGELASKETSYPGTYGVALLDGLARVSPEMLRSEARITVIS